MRKLSLFASLGSAAVAMIVLIDIATAQGPQGLNSYIYAQPLNQPIQEYRPIPPTQYQVGFGPRPEYQEIKKEGPYGEYPKGGPYQKNFKKEHEKEHEKKNHHHNKESEKEHEKEYEKEKFEKEYNKEKGESSPGMFSSLTNTMSKAWSNLG